MANVIKYNTGSVPTNAIKSGSFDIGVNFGGYGLTSATGYWNGKTPNVSGYTIYQANGASSPILYTAANDAELITYASQLGGGVITTIGQALTYFNSSSTLTCANVDYSNIVTTNLCLNLDAGFTPSYPKTGTSWKDLTGSGTTGSLVNGPVYSSDGGGCIVFDGTNDYVLSTSPSLSGSAFTLAVWVKPIVTPASVTFLSIGSVAIDFNTIYLQFLNDTTVKYNTLTDNLSATIPSVTGNWNYIVVTMTISKTLSIYCNGTLINSGTMTGLYSGNTNVTVGGYNVGSIVQKINASIANVQIYNRELSNEEILQNYYAGLQRFIPTDGLVLYLDGNNTNKQVMTASTANDISGNNYNGTLTNGVALARDGQRSFSFDGTNDYIRVDGTILQDSGGTINIWFKPLGLPPSGFTSYIFAAVGTNSDRYYLVVNNNASFSVCRGNPNVCIGGSVNTLNVWYNFTMTWDSTNFSRYLNGVQQGVTTSYTASGTTTTFIIGGYTSPLGTQVFNGNIGQVRIYNRPLTATEVSTIYTAGTVRYGL